MYRYFYRKRPYSEKETYVGKLKCIFLYSIDCCCLCSIDF